MTFNQIKELRKAGKLSEALQAAQQELETDPQNIWNKRSIAWVFYDLLKSKNNAESYSDFIFNLSRIIELQLPEDEKMIFDSCCWQVGSMIFSLNREENVDINKINELFELIKQISFSKQSEQYSFLFRAFHKNYSIWNHYVAFVDWWGFENFRSEDYLKEEYNGKMIMSIVEQAYIAYAKKLLEGNTSDNFNNQRNIDKEKLESFLPKLEKIMEQHPEYQYPPYFKAKLLIALGKNDDDVLSAFRPFAKQKRNDFWVWQLLAEIFTEDREAQFACYCKALSINAMEDFLVKIRPLLTDILVEKKMYSEAKTEIEIVLKTLNKNGWSVNAKIANWMKTEWYKTAVAKVDNSDLYLKYIGSAEEILFSNIEEEVVVVEFVNKNKGLLSFVKNKQKHGFFKFVGYLESPKIGELLKVRFANNGKDGFYKTITVKKVENNESSQALKSFEGNLKIIPPFNYGFVQDVLIHQDIISENKFEENQNVKGTALLSYNKKKNVWGWKAFYVEKIEDID